MIRIDSEMSIDYQTLKVAILVIFAVFWPFWAFLVPVGVPPKRPRRDRKMVENGQMWAFWSFLTPGRDSGRCGDIDRLQDLKSRHFGHFPQILAILGLFRPSGVPPK